MSLKMEDASLSELKERIRLHEGYRLECYEDHLGFLTGGIGHKMLPGEEVPTTEDGWLKIYDENFDKAIEGAAKVGQGMDLPDRKFGVFIEMAFQLGATGLAKFKKALAAARDHQWQICHDQLLDSRWNKQTPNRAKQLAEIMLED